MIRHKIQKIIQLLNNKPDIESLYFKLTSRQLEHDILNKKNYGLNKDKYTNHDIIVSLTSYGKRLHTVHLAIESIMQQTMKPNRIILWLSEDYSKVHLPIFLQEQQKRGLEIRFCQDLRSYKKLIPTLKIAPEDAIITIDDDLIYNFDMLENLIIPYLENPKLIYCNRQHKILFNNDKSLKPYNEWEYESPNLDISFLNFPTGGAGTIYPPHCFDDEIFNENTFLSICAYADDVWFKAMSLKKGTLSKKVETRNKNGVEYIENPEVQDIGLWNINTKGENLNDKQIKAVFEKYNLYPKLLENGNFYKKN